MRLMRSQDGPTWALAVLGGLAVLALAIGIGWAPAPTLTTDSIAQNIEQTTTELIPGLAPANSAMVLETVTETERVSASSLVAEISHIDANIDNAANTVEERNAHDTGDTADPTVAQIAVRDDQMPMLRDVHDHGDTADPLAANSCNAGSASYTEARDVVWLGVADLTVHI